MEVSLEFSLRNICYFILTLVASNNKPVSVMFLHDLILTFYAESKRQNSNPIVLIALTLIKVNSFVVNQKSQFILSICPIMYI